MLKPVAALAAAALALGACGDVAPEARPGQEPTTTSTTEVPADGPNVVVVMTDDQTLASAAFMQNVRDLVAAEGTTFTNAVVTYSSCCPSRATYLTGQYSWNHGVRTNAPPSGGYSTFRAQATALPAALEAAGYRTIHIGKYLNGYGVYGARAAPPGWTQWYGLVDPTSYRYFDWSMLVGDETVEYGEDDDDYQTDVLAGLAVDAVEREAEEPGPFFLNVAFLAPHAENREIPVGARPGTDLAPPVPAPRHVGAFADAEVPRPPSFDEVDVSDKPAFIGDLRAIRDDQLAVLEEHYRRELEALLSVDEAIGALVDALDRTGELEDTVVVFTSDNGFLHGEHRVRWGKYYPYEESIRVPLLVRGPGVARGAVVTDLVANVDLAPTVLDLAGVEPLRPPDGVSLAPALRGQPLAADRAVVIEGRGAGVVNRQPAFVGLRTPGHLYVEYDDGGRELYDLVADPFQLANLAGTPEAADVQAQLATRLDGLVACAGATCLG